MTRVTASVSDDSDDRIGDASDDSARDDSGGTDPQAGLAGGWGSEGAVGVGRGGGIEHLERWGGYQEAEREEGAWYQLACQKTYTCTLPLLSSTLPLRPLLASRRHSPGARG